eukprot:6186685-Pyramimonas_sp.AAC.1
MALASTVSLPRSWWLEEALLQPCTRSSTNVYSAIASGAVAISSTSTSRRVTVGSATTTAASSQHITLGKAWQASSRT